LSSSKVEKVFQGNGVSPGIVLGQALKMDSHNRAILKIQLAHENLVEEEVSRFQKAVKASKEQLSSLKAQLEEKVGREHAFILDVHVLMLEDKGLQAEIIDNIRKYKANAEWAVCQATDRILRAYESLEDEYFRERRSDIESALDRILLNLSGGRSAGWKSAAGDLIIVSHRFDPSAFAALDAQKVKGLALETGGRTSHTAIIARGMRLPAVMGIPDLLPFVASGDTLLLNGDDGQLVINPSTARIEALRERIDRFRTGAEPVAASTVSSPITTDGAVICLQANTEFPHEVIAAKKCGAEGIGLFRSEFLFFGHPLGYPSMEEQFETYRKLVEEMAPYAVAIRTLDTGGDKGSAGDDTVIPSNTNMGLRGIRVSLLEKVRFMEQIEAILRAGCTGKVEIVLPMITTIQEIWEAKRLIEQTRERISKALGSCESSFALGAMIEVPAAVLSLETLAREVDFLCVGTNDLVQYLLAVDRGNPQVAHLFQPLHPAILRCLSHIIDVCGRIQKRVRVCGEISANPFFAVLLLGMGFTNLSMNPLAVPIIRRVIHEISLADARLIAKRSLEFITAQEIADYLIEAIAPRISLDLTPFIKEIRDSNGQSSPRRSS
jgi:phosphoenolpyruvate-protein phosphotransferase (PTS system enzyme I)